MVFLLWRGKLELRKNRIKQKVANGETAFIAMGITHPDDIDAFGPNGFDGVWLEGEHGWVDPSELGNLTRACDIWGMTSVARINANDQGLIYRTLDRGAQAIVVPHVNTREEAENVVEGGKFAPIGKRGLFTSRQGYGVSNYYQKANEETALMVLIEDIAAWENLDSILEVDGIDAFFVAPSDFAASMGYIGEFDHPEVKDKIEDSLKRIIKSGRTAATLASQENVRKFVQMGVQIISVSIGAWLAESASKFRNTATSD